MIAKIIPILGGPPLRGNRFPAWWRGSSDPNCSTDGEVYFDHARGCGGDAVRLVAEVNACDIREALSWLESNGFRPVRGPMTRGEVAKAKLAAATKAKRANELQHFRVAFDRFLDRQKLEAAQRDDMTMLERAASQQYRLQCDPIAEFEVMERSNPSALRRLIDAGHEDWQDAARVTAVAVRLMSGMEAAPDAE